jgi:hypothetical protein
MEFCDKICMKKYNKRGVLMKKKSLIIVLMLLVFSFSMFSSGKEFKKGKIYVTPKIGLYTWAFNFGCNAEYALTENIGVGGDIMMAFFSDALSDLSVITPSAFLAYHFTQIEAKKLDVFAAAFLGYAIVSYKNSLITVGASSSLFLNPSVGARYYFSDTMAGYINLSFAALGAYTGLGAVIGVTFALK